MTCSRPRRASAAFAGALSEGLSRPDRALVAAFFVGTLVIVVLDDGTRFVTFLPGLVALLVPLGLGILLWDVAFRTTSRFVRWGVVACGLLALGWGWLIYRQATLANDAFVRVTEGVPIEEIHFLENAATVEPTSELAAAGAATYFGEPTSGELRTIVWTDWIGGSYAVTLDAETSSVVSTFHGDFGRGKIGARQIGVLAVGFILGLPLFASLRYFVRKREGAASESGA